MAFLLDHLTAILVGTTLLGALLFMQQRGQQTAAETTLRHRTETQTASFLATLTRELENARTQRQITTGLGTWEADGLSKWTTRAIQVSGRWETKQTSFITFVTLASPESGANSPLIAVGYRAVELTDSTEVNGVKQPLYRVDRWVYEASTSTWVKRGGSAPNLTRFYVRMLGTDGNYWSSGTMRLPPSSAEILVNAANDGVGRKTGDQAATSRTRLTQQKLTVRNTNANSTGAAAIVVPAGDRIVIPSFPGNPPLVDPPTSTGGGDDGEQSGGRDDLLPPPDFVFTDTTGTVI